MSARTWKEAVFRVDRTKTALNGINDGQIAALLNGAVNGETANALRLPDQVHPLPIVLQLPRGRRMLPAGLGQLPVKNGAGNVVFLSELGTFEEKAIDQPIYHKNLQRVVHVFGVFISTLFTLVVVPVVYYMAYARRDAGKNEHQSWQCSICSDQKGGCPHE